MPAMLRTLIVLSLLAGVGVGARVACGADPPYDVVTEPTLHAGDPIPPPRGPVVLRVYGGTAPPNAEGYHAFDRATLQRLGLVRYAPPNRWIDGPPRLTGVLLSRLLRLVGVPEGASELRMRALNDYVARMPLTDATRWPVMLALEMNGTPLTVRDKGPLWVVYPSHVVPELGETEYQSKWIWQLAVIRIQ